MKYLLLSLMRIKEDFLSRPFLMTLYAIGTSISVLIFSIFWCNVPKLIEKYQENSESQRTYSIQFEKLYDIDMSGLEFLESYDVEKINIVRTYDNIEEVKSGTKQLRQVGILSVVLKNTIPDSVHAELVNDISDYIDKNDFRANIATPLSDMTLKNEINRIKLKIIETVILYIVCVIGCGSLFKYIFDINTYENIIYAMTGASKKSVVKIVVLESVILTFISSVISLLLNMLLKDNLLSAAFEYKISYNIGDYFLIMVSALLLSFVVMVPFFYRYLREPIIKVKREL